LPNGLSGPKRILVLEEKLMKATIVEDQSGGNSEKIHLGVRVMLENLNNGKQIEYSIVDSVGANPSLQKISFESPLAQALIGKTKGDEIELKVPAGMVKYRVIDIKKKEVNSI